MQFWQMKFGIIPLVRTNSPMLTPQHHACDWKAVHACQAGNSLHTVNVRFTILWHAAKDFSVSTWQTMCQWHSHVKDRLELRIIQSLLKFSWTNQYFECEPWAVTRSWILWLIEEHNSSTSAGVKAAFFAIIVAQSWWTSWTPRATTSCFIIAQTFSIGFMPASTQAGRRLQACHSAEGHAELLGSCVLWSYLAGHTNFLQRML